MVNSKSLIRSYNPIDRNSPSEYEYDWANTYRCHVNSDTDRAHTASEFPEYQIQYIDPYTHAGEIRGYLRFDTWGVAVEGGRILTDDRIELILGSSINDRVRFARERGPFLTRRLFRDLPIDRFDRPIWQLIDDDVRRWVHAQ
ncbi:DUF7532 family protein [Haladaptatus salinisoli]|uniref:DUF7532 family protein n=1 Tax=Haladaptatus salinisoli TaxID=2884876 RepID=UPI003F5E616F